jgi:MoaA/NifB/PqqE/SkfB family radical SAM enzyme
MNVELEQKPMPWIGWNITDLCNYRCPYCYYTTQVIRHGHCPDERIQKVFEIIETLEDRWRIELIGGEPMFHPRFIDMCRKIRQSGHYIKVDTNFSAPEEKVKEFIEASGDSLVQLTISLHESQIKDIDQFISNVVYFKDHKSPETSFHVASVVTEENFERLRGIDEKLKQYGVMLRFQILKERGCFATYPKPIEEYISGRSPKNLEVIRKRGFQGCKCYAGKYSFKIGIDGRVYRCHNFQPYYYLGNIDKGTFEPLKEAIPCFSKVCTCTIYKNLNLICEGEKAGRLSYLYWYLRGCLKNLPLKAYRKKRYFLIKAKQLKILYSQGMLKKRIKEKLKGLF